MLASAEDSYGTCGVVAQDPKLLVDAVAEGVRFRYGRLPMAGCPRITRPRRRKNADGVTGFSLVDPAGNWILAMAARPDPEPARPAGRLARALEDAVVLGDSHGDVDQAATILAGAVRRHSDDASPIVLIEALAFLLELSVRRGDATGVREVLGRIDALDLSDTDRTAAPAALASVAELRAAAEDLDADHGRP